MGNRKPMNMRETQKEEEKYYISPGTGPGDIPIWLAIFLTVCIHMESQTSEQLGQDDDRSPHLPKLFPEPRTTAQLLVHFHRPTQQGETHLTDI
jgi:hypothetical protein